MAASEDLVRQMVVLEHRQAQRLAWLDANAGAPDHDAKRAIYDGQQARLEAITDDWQRVARAARLHAIRIGDDARRQLVAFGLDYAHTVGDRPDDLREQWSSLLTLNHEPCPF